MNLDRLVTVQISTFYPSIMAKFCFTIIIKLININDVARCDRSSLLGESIYRTEAVGDQFSSYLLRDILVLLSIYVVHKCKYRSDLDFFIPCSMLIPFLSTFWKNPTYESNCGKFQNQKVIR